MKEEKIQSLKNSDKISNNKSYIFLYYSWYDECLDSYIINRFNQDFEKLSERAKDYAEFAKESNEQAKTRHDYDIFYGFVCLDDIEFESFDGNENNKDCSIVYKMQAFKLPKLYSVEDDFPKIKDYWIPCEETIYSNSPFYTGDSAIYGQEKIWKVVGQVKIVK